MTKKDKEQFVKEKIKIPGRKTYDEVFDKSTLLLIYDMMTDGYFDIIENPISTGKEAKVFKGLKKDGTPVAIKVMRINTAVFKKYRKYIEGDYRFKDIPSGRKLVFTWAKKEYKNLRKMHEGGIRVPEPYGVSKNILVMEYLEHLGHPAPMVKDVKMDENDVEMIYEEVMGYMTKLYNKIEFVHGDMSEYNILISQSLPYLIDVSQSVPLSHPHAEELFNRDVDNLARYFSEMGIDTSKEQIIDKIRSEE
ncbi:MAG: serine protein kinase RIO [Thermoplasmatota archaeon]